MPAVSQYGQINFRDQVIMITPPLLRSVTMIDWGASLVKPLDDVMDLDWNYIYDQYIKGNLTGQKMVMQAGLNSLFRITQDPFILIETVRGQGGTTYMFNEGELQQTYMFNEVETEKTYMFNEAEDQGTTYDFIVKMPTIYASSENIDKLEKQVDIIKLTGRTYQIITY